jgi:hypothetical protein
MILIESQSCLHRKQNPMYLTPRIIPYVSTAKYSFVYAGEDFTV